MIYAVCTCAALKENAPYFPWDMSIPNRKRNPVEKVLFGRGTEGGPCEEGVESGAEGLAPWGKGILNARRNHGVAGAVDDAVALHLPELLGEHLLGDGGDGAFEIGETENLAAEELEKNEELPATLQHAESLFDALGGGERGPLFRRTGRGGRRRGDTYFFVRSSNKVCLAVW